MYNIVAFVPARMACKGLQLLHLRKTASLSNRPAIML